MEEPEKDLPSEDWEHYELYDRVRKSLSALPVHFSTDIVIEGLDAHDLFSLNTVIGATIEDNVVETLNNMRSIWDPDNLYADCSFIRQSQTFPDVLFVQHKGEGEVEPIMGIELKGWFLLSTEKEPSYRYKVNKNACARQDLIAVVPWSLDNVISGTPEVYDPFVTPAKYAAEYVDYYWKVLRDTDLDTTIERPEVDVEPYPGPKSDKIQDKPVSDSGGNYGRFARSKVMGDYVNRKMKEELSGIPAEDWIKFLKDNSDKDSQFYLDDF